MMLLNLPLPQHVTLDILLRLPFETLLTLKLVSKQLKNLINDANFQNLYNNKSVAFYFGNNGVYCLITRHSIETPPYTVHRIPLALDNDNGFLDFDLLSGSSNTIACVKSPTGHFLFYNLFTGASYTVEGSLKERDCPPPLVWICFGFGYDRFADDYNILEVYSYDTRSESEKYDGIRFDTDSDLYWVYSFKNRGWKSAHGYPYTSYNRPVWEAACSFNGVLHWVVVKRGLGWRVVLTYDLHARGFGEMTLPAGGADVDERGTAKVSELDGRLCYVWQRGLDLCVWVMQEYGKGESWAKLMAFEDVSTRFNGTRFGQAAPAMLYERRDGRKVLLFGRHIGVKLFWYDVDDKEVEVVKESFGKSVMCAGRKRTADVMFT